MSREYRSCILFTSEKSNPHRKTNLFRTYTKALSYSPAQYVRMRDNDALARFAILSALVCNNYTAPVLTDAELALLAGISCILYDSVAYFKHSAEAETNTTFAYAPADTRVAAFRQYRDVLWALDATWARSDKARTLAVNFVRLGGGPIHVMMDRYRFVEEGLSMGKGVDDVETRIEDARDKIKLWNRVELRESSVKKDGGLCEMLKEKRGDLMFDGLEEYLRREQDEYCSRCCYQNLNMAGSSTQRFSGVELCRDCKDEWRSYLETLHIRAGRVFPELNSS